MEETFIVRTCGCHVGQTETLTVVRSRPAAIIVAERIAALTAQSAQRAGLFLEGNEPGLDVFTPELCYAHRSGRGQLLGAHHYANIQQVHEFIPGKKEAQ